MYNCSLLFKITFLFTFSRQNQLKDQQQQQVVPFCPDDAECLTVPRYKRDLVQKLKILRQELSQQQPQAGHCRIEVSREEIFEVNLQVLFLNIEKLTFSVTLFSKNTFWNSSLSLEWEVSLISFLIMGSKDNIRYLI